MGVDHLRRVTGCRHNFDRNMKRHVKIYLDHFRLTTADPVFCEICDQIATDIHHIDARGMGGDPQGKKDNINNLMALCRPCHDRFGDRKQYVEYLIEVHKGVLNAGNKH